MSRASVGSAGALLWVGLVAACTPAADGPERAEIETVDVEGAIDESLDTSDDPVGYVPLEQFGGVLPVDFPPDLPVYSPSSLVDFGTGEGAHFVLLATPDPPATVRERLTMQLEREGWAVRGGEPWRVSKEGRSATIRVIGDVSGSEIRIDYR